MGTELKTKISIDSYEYFQTRANPTKAEIERFQKEEWDRLNNPSSLIYKLRRSMEVIPSVMSQVVAHRRLALATAASAILVQSC
jgi:hypothetical protein